MQYDAYLTTVAIPPHMTLSSINDARKQMTNSDLGMMARVNMDKLEMTVTIIPEQYRTLGDAPAGTHEFARGWITRGLMTDASNTLHARFSMDGEDVVWKRVTLIDGGHLFQEHEEEIRV